jgi:hypothetical protein
MGKMIFTVLVAVASWSARSSPRGSTRGSTVHEKRESNSADRRSSYRQKVRALYLAGESLRAIAAGMGLTKSTVFNIVNVN